MKILGIVFGRCRHTSMTWVRRDEAGLYRRCTGCATRFPYDWVNMRLLPPNSTQKTRKMAKKPENFRFGFVKHVVFGRISGIFAKNREIFG